MQARPGQLIDFAAFQDPPSAIFRDFLNGDPKAAPFYDGGAWDADAVAEAAGRTLRVERDRASLAAALTRQQEQRGATRAAEQAARLAQDDSVAIVTGQQAGVFGGPLFVLYKALATWRVAAELERRRGRPVVPVFWVASDDHDFAEVRHAQVLDESGQIRALRYAPAHEPSGQPTARIVLDASIVRLVEELAQRLPAGPHRDAAIARVAEWYRPERSLASAFAGLLSSCLPELVVLDPADPALKALMGPVMRREVAEASPTSRLALAQADALHAAGYHQQVPVRPGFLNVFVLDAGERRALAVDDGALEVRGGGRRLTRAEAQAAIEREPAAWSPGALLRPLAQDLILPTAAYVGGPAEIAYHAQIGPSYAHFGIPRPALLPRPSLTLVEPSQARVLESEQLSLPELQADPEGRVAQWAREANPEVEAAFEAARAAVEREMGAVEDVLGRLDPTLRGAADAARGRALHQVETLREKALRALKKRDQARADRLRRTRDALFPGGLLQERGLGWIGYVARHGPGLIDDIRNRIDPWARAHQVFYL
jgi:bacillithiol biosynthesis cysteine-adding enzyme BshC